MSDKRFDKLNVLDQTIRRTLKLGMDDGVFLTIEYIYGFEKFNTRPYHNYESWAGGYRVTDPCVMDWRYKRQGKFPLSVEREDLDDAINDWVKAREESEVNRRAAEVAVIPSEAPKP